MKFYESFKCLRQKSNGKQCLNWAFNIPLESHWSVNIQNVLAFFICSYESRIMVKRRVKSQHTNLGSKGQMTSNEGMQHDVKKISTRIIKWNGCMPKLTCLKQKAIWGSNIRDNKSFSFRTPTWESWNKMSFGCNPIEKHKIYYMEEGGGLLSSLIMWV